MSFKIVIFAAAVLACQANAQMGGIIRPFATGFTNGLNEMAKPFVQFGQSVMAPAGEYFSANRRPQVSQWMSYPAQMIPQAQAGIYDGYEAITSAMPGASYFQAVRPPTVIKPQTQYYQIPSQTVMRPPRPYPAPAPTASASEESGELYKPSTLLIKPSKPVAEVPKPDVPMTLESKFEVPTVIKPTPLVEDKE